MEGKPAGARTTGVARSVALVALLSISSSSAVAQETKKPEPRRPTAHIVLRDAIAGGLVGSAFSGGIISYKMGVQDDSHYDWGRALAWGAVIGLGAGLVSGLANAATTPTYAMTSAMTSRRAVRDGLSETLDVCKNDQSGRQVFPLVMRRF